MALRHRDEALRSWTRSGQRDRILGELPGLGVEAFPSDANFVLFRPPGNGAAVWRALLDRGVLVRDFTSVIPDSLRVTAGTPEVDLFLSSRRSLR